MFLTKNISMYLYKTKKVISKRSRGIHIPLLKKAGGAKYDGPLLEKAGGAKTVRNSLIEFCCTNQ